MTSSAAERNRLSVFGKGRRRRFDRSEEPRNGSTRTVEHSFYTGVRPGEGIPFADLYMRRAARKTILVPSSSPVSAHERPD